jgi:hypothetical protein
MAVADESQDQDLATAMVEDARQQEGVAGALNESALAGGVVGFAVAAAAFLAARLARTRRRRRA